MRLYRPLLPLLLSASLLPAWAATGPALVYTGGDFIAEQQNAQIHQQAVTLFTQMSGVSVKEITPVGAADRLTQLRQLLAFADAVVIVNKDLFDNAGQFRTEFHLVFRRHLAGGGNGNRQVHTLGGRGFVHHAGFRLVPQPTAL